MDRNKVRGDDSSLLRNLLDEVTSGGELETTVETSEITTPDQDHDVGLETPMDLSDYVLTPDVPVYENEPVPGPSGDSKPQLRYRPSYKRPRPARPTDYDSDKSDTIIDDTDEDRDYSPSESSPSSDQSKLSKLFRGKGNRRGRGRCFAASTPVKKTPARLKISKPKIRPSDAKLKSVDRRRPSFVLGSDHETGIDLLDIESSGDETTSSVEDNEDELDSNDEESWFQMRDGDIMPDPPFRFMEEVGPKHMPPPDSNPISYFNLFFTTALITAFVNETNRYARQCIEKAVGSGTLKRKSRASEWVPVHFQEMKVFIACILNMGIVKKCTIASYWTTLASSATPWFGQMFPRNRFQLILKFFHLVDNGTLDKSPYDPCAKFQPIVDHANKLFRHYYVPHEQLSIDESLIGTKSHTSLLQYLPNKQHHRWGIKLWVLCDSVVNYILAFSVYRGAVSQEEKKNQKDVGVAHMVVIKLLQVGNYLNKGYHVFVDNFYSSIPLARFLYDAGTYITGTIRMNRKQLPKEAKSKFDVGETKFFKNGPLLLCGHRDKKSQKNQVLILSSKAQNSTTEVERRVRHQPEPGVIKKPDVILDYNKFMGGVDVSDMMIYAYLDERRTLKYWKKVVFNVMSRMVSNLYILYKENLKTTGKKPMTRLQFTETIVDTIGKEWLAHKNTPPEAANPPQENPLFGIKRLPGTMTRKCYGCSTQERLRRSHFVCVRCDRGLHPECIAQHKCKK